MILATVCAYPTSTVAVGAARVRRHSSQFNTWPSPSTRGSFCVADSPLVGALAAAVAAAVLGSAGTVIGPGNASTPPPSPRAVQLCVSNVPRVPLRPR